MARSMCPAVEKRRVLLQEELEWFIEEMTDRFRIQKVVMFRSLATGDIHEWSDLDLVVVGGDSPLPFLSRTKVYPAPAYRRRLRMRRLTLRYP